ncbi:MAG TPA: hypothetical protein VEU96_07345 [Bryobacteraceae bacterium]|nr:hypothetical protein [Bryobacteraceae bacterium]
MRQLCFVLLFFSGGALRAQVEQLATSGDGHTLLFHTRFRLQSETELGSTGKIYRFQDGQITRVAVAPDIGFAISPTDYFGPFLSTDGSVVGWQINIGCGLCQIIVAPPLSSQISGVSFPAGFPRGTVRMSPNGRYFTADDYPFRGPQYLDASTGAVADIPVDLFARPIVREVADNGTTLLLITPSQDPVQYTAPDTLSLWKPGADPQPVYSENRVFGPTISGNGARIAFESVVDGGPNDDQRTLLVMDTQTLQQIQVASMPSKDYRALFDSFSHPRWDQSGTKLIYRTFDDQPQPVAISLWDAGTQTSSVILNNSEGFADAVISGDGSTVWAGTNNNRLLQLNLATGATDEILPPLGSIGNGADTTGIAGSALFLQGAGFTTSQTVLDGSVQLPIVAVEPQGLWVQIPWEYAPARQENHKLLIRSQDNPFEALASITVSPGIQPYLPRWIDPATLGQYAKAVHQDFQSLVTPANPTHPGEVVHVYLTGLGPLDHPLPTGAPGPLDPLSHPVTPLSCSLGGNPLIPMEILDVTYAVGLVGIYQADIRIPDTIPSGSPTLFCSSPATPGFNTTAHISITPAQ